MSRTPKSPARPTRAKASKPEVRPLDEHLAALLSPGLVRSGDGGFGEMPQAGFEVDAPSPGDRVRDKGLTRAAMLADAPKRVRQGNVKRFADEDADTPLTNGTVGAGATVDALKQLLEQGDPRFREKRVWTPHRPPRPASACLSSRACYGAGGSRLRRRH